MRFGAPELGAVLEECLPAQASGLVVAVSGGGDSACLLTALAQLRGPPACRAQRPLRAVHVDHGLQAAAAALRESAHRLCGRLGVELTVIAVTIESAGDSLEAAARTARYRAFAACLAPGECLLTAHHADDQAETVLLQLLRGAGVKGMSAMPARRRLGAGWHVRPLLEISRRELRQYARDHAIEACEDPMNSDPRFDRAYLRAELWPRILARWPGAAGALGRAARHAADAQGQLDRNAGAALARLRDGAALSLPGLRGLPARERVHAVRRWLAESQLPPPSAARLAEGLRQALEADGDHVPAVLWGANALRRYRQRLYLTAADPPALCAAQIWERHAQPRLALGAGLGSLHWAPRDGGLDAQRLPAALTVRRRRGGEALKPAAHGGSRSLAHLCQERGIVPWMRDALPLIYAGESLVAVGDLWRDARFLSSPRAPGLICVWQDAPELG